jgi:hypothetical protein
MWVSGYDSSVDETMGGARLRSSVRMSFVH